MLDRPFGAADIVALSRNPDRDLSLRTGTGFSFPQRGWIYAAAEGFYRAERSPAALWATFDRVVTGREMTPWKAERRGDLKSMLDRFLTMDKRSEARFVESAFASPTRVITWREHELCLPLGLLLDDDSGRGLRLLWIERALQLRKRSSSLLATATLAALETSRGEIAWLEAWFLRTGEVGRYLAKDLRSNWLQLDRILAAAEEQAGGSAR